MYLDGEFTTRSLDSFDDQTLVKQSLDSFMRTSQVERNVLMKCNHRLDGYIERVRELEVENGKLLREKDELISEWGVLTRDTQVAHEMDLDLLREQIENNERHRDDHDSSLARLVYEQGEYEYRNDELRNLIENNRHIRLELEQEACIKSEMLKTLEMSVKREREEIVKYTTQRDTTWSHIGEIYLNLNYEKCKRYAYEHSMQTLREKIDFLRQVFVRQELEMSLLSADSTQQQQHMSIHDQHEFYRDHLRRIIKEIRSDYEQLANEQTRLLREHMRSLIVQLQNNLKTRLQSCSIDMDFQESNVNTLRTTLTHGEKELTSIRGDTQNLLKRLNDLEEHADGERTRISELIAQQEYDRVTLNDLISQLNNDVAQLNTSRALLDYELQVYKRLVDSELNRLSNLKKSTADEDILEECLTSTQTPVVSSGSLNGKILNKKEIYGHVGIDDVSPNGSYIIIRNYSLTNESVNVSGWRLSKKSVDASQHECTFNFPQDCVLNGGACIRIWSNNEGNDSVERDGDLINKNNDTWGVGLCTVSVLSNAQDEVKSIYSQEISFNV